MEAALVHSFVVHMIVYEGVNIYQAPSKVLLGMTDRTDSIVHSRLSHSSFDSQLMVIPDATPFGHGSLRHDFGHDLQVRYRGGLRRRFLREKQCSYTCISQFRVEWKFGQGPVRHKRTLTERGGQKIVELIKVMWGLLHCPDFDNWGMNRWERKMNMPYMPT